MAIGSIFIIIISTHVALDAVAHLGTHVSDIKINYLQIKTELCQPAASCTNLSRMLRLVSLIASAKATPHRRNFPKSRNQLPDLKVDDGPSELKIRNGGIRDDVVKTCAYSGESRRVRHRSLQARVTKSRVEGHIAQQTKRGR
jgi:hypothetical protein